MVRFLTRRHVIGAGGAMALSPLVKSPQASAAPGRAPQIVFPGATPAGPLVVYFEPIRVFDSRTEPVSLGGGKLSAGNSVAVTVPGAFEDGTIAVAVFINCTITDTEGAGYLLIRASDLSGERPLPKTSNINWSTTGQTLANFAIVPVGGENALEVHAGGGGKTHFVVDVQGYVPYDPGG